MGNRWTAGIAASVLVLIAFLYWPVLQGDFVWDDIVNFRWNTWLTEGDQWKHYIFRDFNYWKYYFRPLVVGLFTLQLRLFDGAAGPMHLVSLAIHLVNTLLVGLLALRCAAVASPKQGRRILATAIPMGLFGLHPAMIEAVAWVGCQYDLLLTMFTLLGLLANTIIRSATKRAVIVAICFFLAACTKESAIAFPMVLALFAWTLAGRQAAEEPPSKRLRRFLTREWATLLGVLLAGAAYLAFRHLAMGPSVMPRIDSDVSLVGHIQMVCFTYMRYWAMVFAPMAGMSPVHEFDPLAFELLTPASVSIDLAACFIVLVATVVAWRRASASAGIALVLTVSLLPVLRILPTAFNPNLYHDRYLMCGLAVACAMLPLLQPRLPQAIRDHFAPRVMHLGAAALATAWFAVSIAAIRTTVPLWANETTLWTWAYATSPDSKYAISNLLELHLSAGRLNEARVLADRVMDERIACTGCLLSAARLALHDRDAQRASAVLRILTLNEKLYRNEASQYARIVKALRSFVHATRSDGSMAAASKSPTLE